MTVAVLGHRGMLGSVVARYFAEQGADVQTTDLRYDGSGCLPSWAGKHDMTVNCITGGWLEYADLPGFLAMTAQRYIHPSTDAIGEDTAYAAMKRQGEDGTRGRAVIIRAGLVDLRRQHEVAYTNWLCNPVTPLEWARIAWSHRDAQPGVYQYGREPLDRYELSRAVRQLWHLPPPQPAIAPESSDRTLTSLVNLPPIDVALLEYRAWLSERASA